MNNNENVESPCTVEEINDYFMLDSKRYDEVLPWDFVSVGVDKEYLIKESKKAKAVQTTPSCLKTCSGCGLIKEGLCNGCR